MRYEGAVYRPPSEAYSLIIQVTIGCAHNKCTFCSMYKEKKFRVRNIQEVFEDLQMARECYPRVRRIFLADGDALVLKTEDLKAILLEIKRLFPECERVGVYSAPKDILNKTVQELIELKNLGLKIAYLGVETGSDKILKEIKKGVTSQQMIEAGRKIKKSGIKLSTTLISGIGGKDKWKEHALESAKVINSINPDYLGLLTLMVQRNTEIYKKIVDKSFKLLSPEEIMIETREFIKHLDLDGCIFRSNHASNYRSLGGTFPKDKERLLKELDETIQGKFGYKNEAFRAL